MATPTLKKILSDIEQLSSEDRWKLVAQLQAIETEQEWEDRVLRDALGSSLRPEGSIDFDALYAQEGIATGLELHQAYPEFIDEDGHIHTLKKNKG
jgi:hypothetical protein